jgi:acyl carrier protein
MHEPQSDLRHRIKELIVTTLRLDGIQPEQIGDHEPLFAAGGTLGLDSLGALELLVALEYTFKVRFEGDGPVRQHFESVATLASFLDSETR